MDLIRSTLSKLGVDTADLVIKGLVGHAFAETRRGPSGNLFDCYDPKIKEMSLYRGEELVMTLPPKSDVFIDLEKTLMTFVAMPVSRTSIPHGETACLNEVEGVKPFSFPYAKLDIIAGANDEMWKAAFANDDAILEEARWAIFRQADVFEELPCTRDEFVSLFREYSDSQHPRSLRFEDYYRWFRRSEALLDGQGGINEEILQKAKAMLEAWGNQVAEANKYWLVRNLSVHPRHAALFEALVDEVCAARETKQDAAP